MEILKAGYDNLLLLMQEVWETPALGITVGQMMTALGVFLLFWVLRGLFARTVIHYLHRYVESTETTLDDQVLEAVRDPLAFLPVIAGLFFALDFLGLSGVYKIASDNLLQSLIAFALFWALYRSADPFAHILERLNKFLTRAMMEWMVKGVRVLFIFLGIATILELWGVQVAPILAGLGLFGVAVALGAQDLFKNLIAGILILFERRFAIGDWIKVDGIVEGTVERINFRSTMVRRFDKAPVYVPNAKLSDSAVTNFSAMTHRRIYWKIGIEYSSSVEQLRRVREEIESYVLSEQDYAKPPEVSTFVRIDAFNDSSIDIMLYCFTRTTNWGEWLEIKERLAYKIKTIVEEAGTGFAFPSQSLYVESMPEGVAEIYTPPQT